MAEKTSPRGRWLTFLIFGVLVLLGVLLLWFYMSSEADAPEQPAPAPTEEVGEARPRVPAGSPRWA